MVFLAPVLSASGCFPSAWSLGELPLFGINFCASLKCFLFEKIHSYDFLSLTIVLAAPLSIFDH